MTCHVHGVVLSPVHLESNFDASNYKVFIDSGGFTDVHAHKRLTYREALDRQIKIAGRLNATPEMLAGYDLISPLCFPSSTRKFKSPENDHAIETTIKAAEWFDKHRDEMLGASPMFILQGAWPSDFMHCLEHIVPLLEEGDTIGFGSSASNNDKIKQRLREITAGTCAKLQGTACNKVHYLGLSPINDLCQFDTYCRQRGIDPSYDTSSYIRRCAFGDISAPPDFNETVDALSKLDKQRRWTYFNISVGSVQAFWDHWNFYFDDLSLDEYNFEEFKTKNDIKYDEFMAGQNALDKWVKK